MIYEKPAIYFQKFHTDAFLDNTAEDILSNNDPNHGSGEWEWDPNGGFMTINGSGFNGTITLNSDGVGGWLNG